MNSSAVPLKMSKIEAAARLRSKMPEWQASDRTPEALRDRFPELSDSAVLLKTVAINALYGTNLLALSRMASHVKKVLDEVGKDNLASAGPDLVERIASLEGQKTRKHHISAQGLRSRGRASSGVAGTPSPGPLRLAKTPAAGHPLPRGERVV